MLYLANYFTLEIMVMHLDKSFICYKAYVGGGRFEV